MVTNNTAGNASAFAAIANIIHNKDAPKSYNEEYKRFKKWLTAKQLGPDDAERYITRINIDAYFLQHVAKERIGVKNTLKRIINALQWYATYKEYTNFGFNVNNATTERCIDAVLERQKQQKRSGDFTTGKKCPDPHYGLKDVLPEEDREK